MNNNTLLISLTIIFLIGCVLGWFVKDCSNYSKTIPVSKKDSTYVERTQLQPTKKDTTIRIKTEKGKATKRTDKISVQDSSGQKADVTVNTTVVDDSVNVNLSLEMFPIKFIEHSLTEVTKTTIEYVNEPFYTNSWFYATIISITLLILSLLN